ncbi:MAG: septation protein IspZ [Vitreimonas sp.]
MNEPPPPPRPSPAQPGQWIVDLGPVLLFVLSFVVLQRFPAYKDNAVYVATGVFIVAIIAAMIYSQITRGRIPPVLIVTGVIITAFGVLTIALHNETFIKIKNTIENGFFAVAIAGSLLMGQNALRLVFGHAFNMSDRAWTIYAWRWAGLFATLAVVNEIMRNTLTTAGWITWHFPVLFGLTLVFIVANLPFIMKHHVEDEPASSSASD